MKILLNESEVIELSVHVLDLNNPDPDKVHSIASRMDMVYDESLDLYEDVEGHYLRNLRNEYEFRINTIKVQYAELKEKISPSNNA